MKKNQLFDQIISFVLGLSFFIIMVFFCIVFGSCTSCKSSAADNYIKELETTLEINGIDIDDTIGGSDAYAEYYNL